MKHGISRFVIHAIYMVLITLKTGARLHMGGRAGAYKKSQVRSRSRSPKIPRRAPRTSSAADEFAEIVQTTIGLTLAVDVEDGH